MEPIPGVRMACGYLAHQDWLENYGRKIGYKDAGAATIAFQAAAYILLATVGINGEYVTVTHTGKILNLFTVASTDIGDGLPCVRDQKFYG